MGVDWLGFVDGAVWDWWILICVDEMGVSWYTVSGNGSSCGDVSEVVSLIIKGVIYHAIFCANSTY